MLQRATLRRPAQPGTARSPGTGTWPTPGPAARAPDRRSLTPRIAHRRGAAANEPEWPAVTIGVPSAATASRHENPERRSTGGDGGQVAGGFGHPVLGGEADRGRGRGQHAQPGGGVTQPQARPVRDGPGGGRGAGAGGGGEGGFGQGEGEDGCQGKGAGRSVRAKARRRWWRAGLAGRARWREQKAQTFLPDGAICVDERISVSCSEDAPEGQDAVTTRQDGGWICQDVPARV